MYPALELTDPDWGPATAAALCEFAAAHAGELRDAARAGAFPEEPYREMGRRGWLGLLTPVEDGGVGLGVPEYCLVCEEVGRHAMVSPQIACQGQLWLLRWGTPEQRDRYLGPIAAGTAIFSESISEPGVGSSLKLVQSSARRDGGDWILNGRKTHVNLGAQSDVTLVYAAAPEGLTAFLVDTDLPGVSTRQTDPLGLRLIPTADVDLDDVRVPASAVLGEAGQGMATFLTTFNVSRLGNASELIGFGRRALTQAIDYARARRIDADHVVTDFQGIQWTVSNAYTKLHTASLARDHAANLAHAGKDVSLATTLAKAAAIEAAEYATNEAFALTGGHGLYHDTDYGQLLFDTKVLRIAGGSIEVFRNYIARRVLRSDDYEGLR
jgi:alkylation response protein AidB-like acyl-CoA dehydrogenase